MNFLDFLGRKVLILDGAMGTEIVRRKGKVPILGESLNIFDPDLILSIHRDYVEAGADIIETNTFSLNRFKVKEAGLESQFKEMLKRGVALARKAAGNNVLVSGSVGPLGRLLHPLGDLTWDEAYEAFYEVFSVLGNEGVDLFQIETMVDVEEAKIAILAAKESHPEIPVLVSMTFTEDGRTVTGSDPYTAYSILERSKADILSANCGREVEEFLGFSEILSSKKKPFAIYPNAGLPVRKGDFIFYPMSPEEFLKFSIEFYEKGASILGGCCGTTPEHIRLLSSVLKGKDVKRLKQEQEYFFASSRSKTVLFGETFPFRMIGERINPFGSRKMKPIIESKNIEEISRAALEQEREGADGVDVNLGGLGEKNPDFYSSVLFDISAKINIPVFIDVKNTSSVEAGLKSFAGRAVVNSCTGEEERMESVLPLVERYSAGVVAIAIDEDGVADTWKRKVRILEKFLKGAEDFGLGPKDIIFDPVVLSVSTGSQGVLETLKAIEEIKKNFPVDIILGLSNVSYGMPKRKLLNSAFLSMAISRGADSAILRVEDPQIKATVLASEILVGRSSRFMETFTKGIELDISERKNPSSKEEALRIAILDGSRDKAYQLVLELLAEKEPMEIMDNILIPAMREVGDLYEKKVYFLPQLIASAEAMKRASSLIEEKLKGGEGQKRWKIVLATVKGDLHDIGKNIVKAVFSNFGFEVIDLGKNVPLQNILAAVERHKPHAVGLSCLMTTSLDEMERVTREIKSKWPEIKIVLGGATVSPRLVREFGADIYAKDAVDGLKKLKGTLENGHS